MITITVTIPQFVGIITILALFPPVVLFASLMASLYLSEKNEFRKFRLAVSPLLNIIPPTLQAISGAWIRSKIG